MWCHLEYFSFNFFPFFWLLKKSDEVVSFLAEFSVMFGQNKKSCVRQQSDIQKYLILSSISASALLITQLLQVTSAKPCVAAEHSTTPHVLGVPVVMSWIYLMSGHLCHAQGKLVTNRSVPRETAVMGSLGVPQLSFLLLQLGLFCGFNRIKETFTLRL